MARGVAGQWGKHVSSREAEPVTQEGTAEPLMRGSTTPYLLHAPLSHWATPLQVFILPTIRINGVQYRGKMATTEVLRAICAGFTAGNMPQACSKVRGPWPCAASWLPSSASACWQQRRVAEESVPTPVIKHGSLSEAGNSPYRKGRV